MGSEAANGIDRPTDLVEGVLVVGGGYSGLHAAQAVRRAGLPVTVLDRTGRHDFVTRLAAVAGGTAPAGDASRPLRSFVHRVEVGSAATLGDGAVTLDDGRTLEAAAVVVTAGSATSRPPIEGIGLAHALRSAEDASALRGLIAHARSLVIVGGGATGVQLAGAAAAAHPSLEVHLVEAASHLLAGLPETFGPGAMRILESRRVHVHLGHGVESITGDGAVVDGTLLEGVVVWAGGFTSLAERYGLPTDDDGRILVDPTLRVVGHERTFAAGDIAAHRDAHGDTLPMSAQIAVRAGTAAGLNAARLARGQSGEPVELRQIGWVLDLGGRRGLGQVGPIGLTGPVADLIPPLLHDVIDLKDLVEIGGLRALRFAPASVRSLLPWSRTVREATQPAPPVVLAR